MLRSSRRNRLSWIFSDRIETITSWSKDPKQSAKVEVKIDFDGLDQRILGLPVPAGNYRALQAGAAGQVYYLEVPASPPREPGPGGAALQRFDLTKRKADTLQGGVAGFTLTPDAKKVLLFAPPESWSIVETATLGAPAGPAAAQAAAKGKLNTEAIEVGPNRVRNFSSIRWQGKRT